VGVLESDAGNILRAISYVDKRKSKEFEEMKRGQKSTHPQIPWTEAYGTAHHDNAT
jgi:hypothetical protein